MTYSRRTRQQGMLSAFIYAAARRQKKTPQKVFNDYVRYRIIENMDFHLGRKGRIIINGSEALRLQKLPILRESGADLDIDILCPHKNKKYCAMAFRKTMRDLEKEGIIVNYKQLSQDSFEPEEGVNIMVISMPFYKIDKNGNRKSLRGTLHLDIWTNPYDPKDYHSFKLKNPVYTRHHTNVLLYPIERSFVDKITPHTESVNRLERGKDLYDAWHILKDYELDPQKVVHHLEQRMANRPPKGKFDPEIMFPHPSLAQNAHYRKKMNIPAGDKTPDLFVISQDLRMGIMNLLKEGKSPLYLQLDANAKARFTLSPTGRPLCPEASPWQNNEQPTAIQKLKAQSHTASKLPYKRF